MLLTKLAKQIKLQCTRQFQSTLIKNENKSILESSTTSQASKPVTKAANENVIGSPMHNVTKIDRWILVWVKRYPSKEQVPSQVSIECIQRAHTLVRVRISFLMMAIVMLGFFYSAWSGKREAAAERNTYSDNKQLFKEVKDKLRREAEAKRVAEATSAAEV